jgi:hypothetical protein
VSEALWANAVPNRHRGDAVAHLDYDATQLMSRCNLCSRLTPLTMVLVDVTSTNTRDLIIDEDVTGFNGRHLDLFKADVAYSVINTCLHRSRHFQHDKYFALLA